jgi:hypothetical protein
MLDISDVDITQLSRDELVQRVLGDSSRNKRALSEFFRNFDTGSDVKINYLQSQGMCSIEGKIVSLFAAPECLIDQGWGKGPHGIYI